jgi:hypothetical protein
MIIGLGPLALASILSLLSSGFIYYPRMFISSSLPFLIFTSKGLSRISEKKMGLIYSLFIICLMMLSSSIIIMGKHPAIPKNIQPIINKIEEEKDKDTILLVHPPILAYLVKAYNLKEFYSICADVSNLQGSTCSSFITYDSRCEEFIKKISKNFKKAILLNNRALSEMMVDKNNNIHNSLTLHFGNSKILFRESQYDVILYEK